MRKAGDKELVMVEVVEVVEERQEVRDGLLEERRIDTRTDEINGKSACAYISSWRRRGYNIRLLASVVGVVKDGARSRELLVSLAKKGKGDSARARYWVREIHSTSLFQAFALQQLSYLHQ